MFQNDGRHGSVRDIYAVGNRCTKAVAMRTPVPKCFDKKRKRCGTGKFGKRLAAMGNAQAISYQYTRFIPASETRITCYTNN